MDGYIFQHAHTVASVAQHTIPISQQPTENQRVNNNIANMASKGTVSNRDHPTVNYQQSVYKRKLFAIALDILNYDCKRQILVSVIFEFTMVSY